MIGCSGSGMSALRCQRGSAHERPGSHSWTCLLYLIFAGILRELTGLTSPASCWLADLARHRRSVAGEDWRLMIRRAITRDALVFLICFSRDGVARMETYQNEELALAVEQMRLQRPGEPWLIPLRFDSCDIPDLEISPGRTLKSIQRADLFADRFEGAARLIQTVERILRRDDLVVNDSEWADNSAQETRVNEDLQ